MEFLSADRILVVDLETGEVSEDELSEDLVKEKIGGAAINKHLYDQYAEDDPVVIGTGLLTGTLYPASAIGILTAKSPATGKLCHCPINLKVGLEIQYAGFDHIVIKGASEKPVFLWIHDGVADLSDANDVWGKDAWETTDTWRKAMGDDLIQTIVIGTAGEAQSDIAQLSLNYWASADRFAFGKLFGAKKLKGLAFRGMGLLEIADAEEFVDRCLEVINDLKEGEYIGKAGIGDICNAIGESGVKEWLAPVVHRHSACYNTPYPTNTFVYLEEDPKKLDETDIEEPGVLITDIFGLVGMYKLGLKVEDACKILRTCAKLGIDAAAAAELCKAAGKTDPEAVAEALPTLGGQVSRPGAGHFSPWCPTQPIFGEFDDIEDDVDQWWERRQAIAYIFGIHPIFAVISPDLMEEDLVDLAAIGTDLEITDEILDGAIDYLLR